jgi:C-terminal peptidase prc
MDWIRQLVNTRYVDSLSADSLLNASIQPFLSALDPFSSYLPPVQKQAADDDLNGNFEGIGVEFNIIDDSIRVVSALPGGPSELHGILPGDRIVTVNGHDVPAQGLDNEWVIRKLRGKKGSKVQLGIYRPSLHRSLKISVIRDRISIRSVELAWRPAPDIAHIRINKFGEKTHQEFVAEFEKLRKQAPVRKLILDLRGNPGGYLESAVALADEFLQEGLLITFTRGFRQKRQDYFTKNQGLYEKGELVVLIDAGSASASEILTGALMDHGRALVVGERSFGKALVQQQFEYPDGSAVRLTVARYYTPKGHCIQRPYGKDHPFQSHPDIGDSLGGIAPNLEAKPAALQWSASMKTLVGSGAIYDMAMNFAESETAQRLKTKGESAYISTTVWQNSEELQLTQKLNELGLAGTTFSPIEKSQILRTHKALVARILFGNALYQQLTASYDPVLWKAIRVLKN